MTTEEQAWQEFEETMLQSDRKSHIKIQKEVIKRINQTKNAKELVELMPDLWASLFYRLNLRINSDVKWDANTETLMVQVPSAIFQYASHTEQDVLPTCNFGSYCVIVNMNHGNKDLVNAVIEELREEIPKTIDQKLGILKEI